jgi:hypothetical protein
LHIRRPKHETIKRAQEFHLTEISAVTVPGKLP